MNLFSSRSDRETEHAPLPPCLPRSPKRVWVTEERFGGLAHDGRGSAGEVPCTFAAMRNLSPRGGDAIAVRRPRGLYVSTRGPGTPHGMATLGDDLYVVQGNTLWCVDPTGDVTSVGTVANSPKQFVAFGDRLFLFPDKLYVDAADRSLHAMELDLGEAQPLEFAGQTVSLPIGMSWSLLGFFVGDGIRLINADDDIPAPEGYYTVTRLQGRTATVSRSFPATVTARAYIKRPIPDLDRLCVNGNRVFGYHGKDIYVSAAGSALNWNTGDYPAATSGACLHTHSEGAITACAPWQGYVIFFKPDAILRLAGNRADTLTLSETCAPGIPAALSDTLCELDGALYYHAAMGVYRYDGQEPVHLATLSETEPIAGCGGTDGRAYYIAFGIAGEANAESWRQFLYTPSTNAWYAEDDLHTVAAVTRKGFLCEQAANGHIWLTASDERRPPCTYSEVDVSGPVHASLTLRSDRPFSPSPMRPLRLCLRASAPAGATLSVFAATANSKVAQDAVLATAPALATWEGPMQDRLLTVSLPPALCDSLTLRLDTVGDCRISLLAREYERPEV